MGPELRRTWLPYERLALLGLLLTAALLRFYRLGQQPVWCDETYFFMMASQNGWIRTVLQTMAQDVYPPLFFLLLHAEGLASMDLHWLRLPMAMAGIGGVWLLWSLLRRHFGSRAALMGGALAALSPVLVFYSQELKMYSILSLLLLLLLDECLRLLEQPQRPWWRLTLWATLSVYTFYLSLIVWACLLASAAWLRRDRLASLKPMATGFLVAGVLFLPWAPFFLKSVIMTRGAVQNLLMDRVLLYSLQNFSVGFWASPLLAWAALPLFAGLAAYGFRRAAWRSEAQAFLALACLSPLALSWAVSLLSKPMYSDRAMLVCAYAWAGLLGIGLARLPKRWGAALAALAMALMLGQQWRYQHDPLAQRMDYRPAWDYIVSHWRSGDSIFNEDAACYYPMKLFALQEARDPQSPYRDEPGAATFEGSARIAGLRPTWVYEAPPPFPSGASQGRVRQLWRRINAWLGEHDLGIYVGYNRDMVAGERLEKEALPGVRRIWYVTSIPSARHRMDMPQINVWRASQEDGRPSLDPGQLDWLRKGFRLKEKTKVGETLLYLYEAEEPR